jgi:hypothetical protein
VGWLRHESALRDHKIAYKGREIAYKGCEIAYKGREIAYKGHKIAYKGLKNAAEAVRVCWKKYFIVSKSPLLSNEATQSTYHKHIPFDVAIVSL